MVSAIASGVPLYGMCVTSMPVAILSFSRLKCVPLPMPAEAKLSLPGFAFAASTKSRERLPARVRADDQHVRPAAEQREVGEVLQRVVGQLGVDRRVGRRAPRNWRAACSRRASAFATTAEPIEPPAPTRFSATTGWPHISGSFAATTRPMMSVELPGRERDDQPHRLGRVVLRRRPASRRRVPARAISSLRKPIFHLHVFRLATRSRTPAPAAAAASRNPPRSCRCRSSSGPGRA